MINEKYFLNGKIVAIKNARKDYIVRIKPYGVYPINADGVRILQMISENNNINSVIEQLNLGDSVKELEKFLDACIQSGILTYTYREGSGIRVKVSHTSPALERVFFEITNACNLNCDHCYMSASYKVRKNDEVSFKKIREIIEKADEIGVYRMDFTGGEIFTRNDIIDILSLASEHYMVTNLFTNATLITEKQIEKIIALGNIRTIFISLDDIVEEEHDKFRGVPGSYANTIKAITALKKTDIKVVANITLSSRNYSCIEEIINFCRNELQIECRIAPILYVGRGKCFEENDLTLDQIKEAMDISLRNKSKFVSGFCEDESDMKSIVPGCGVGHKMIYIRSNGEMCLCPTLSSREAKEFKVGNIYHDDLQKVWNENEELILFRNSTCGVSDCEYMSICRGGCRSRAYLHSGHLNGIDPIVCHYMGADKELNN